ncbi:MAG: hypothetical protein IJE97_10135, partial [Thermoguttaceae bacterium]|nr:hypothetical protein [Thermoguttaceae bacterium]
NDAIANGRKESGKRRKTKELRETKQGRVAETARETIKTAEGRMGVTLRRGAPTSRLFHFTRFAAA